VAELEQIAQEVAPRKVLLLGKNLDETVREHDVSNSREFSQILRVATLFSGKTSSLQNGSISLN
jgi:hypothetical protein